jgi:di/tricarboxylate transporter
LTGEAWITAVVVVVTLALLARDRYPPSGVVLAAAVALLVLDVIDAEQAFSGFSNSAPITVAALYVLARGAQKTGLLAPLTGKVLGSHGGPGALARLLFPTAAASAFVNNTPLVAMLIPDVVSWAERRRVSASRFLLPLSYAAILGGGITVLGTSTNLVVSGLLQRSGEEPFGLFEITPVGGPVAVVGLLILVFGSSRLLPERLSARERAEKESRGFVVGMEVVVDGPLAGKSVADARLRDLQGVFLVEVERAGEVTAPVTPETVLQGGDHLTFVGRSDQIVDLQRTRGLRSREEKHLLAVDSHRHTFFEAVVGRASPLVGRTLKEADFRGRYSAAVVAIHRAGARVEAKLGDVRLQNGDTLLILAAPRFLERWREGNDFLVVAPIGGPPPSATRKAPIVGAVWAAVILLAAFEALPILEGALLGAAAMMVTRVLTFAEARDAVDLDVVVLIAAAFGIGTAIESSGLAAEIAAAFTDAFAGFGKAGLIFGVVLATVLLTEIITNNAAAVVVFPVAVSVAEPAGIDPRHMAIAVAVAASAAFLTPIGYQTNTMVYGPGGYRFTDYLRAGLPISLATVTLVTVLTTLSS